MRVLFSSTGGDGHLLPLLPLAAAFVARQDEVVVAAPRSQQQRIQASGMRFAEIGPTAEDMADALAAHRRRVQELPVADRRPLAFSGRFGALEAPVRLDPLRRLVARSSPDLVIYESADLAAPIAASEAQIPFVHHAFGRAIPEAALRMAADAVAGLWDSAGLEPDELAGAYRGSYIDICPPSLQLPLPQRPLHSYALRPIEVPPQPDHGRDRPVVYATLGTVFNELATFRLLLEALATIDCDVVMTIGHNRAPADLEPIPGNATVASYIPQAEILQGCDAVIAHGGSGSFLAALAHGRPLVLLPRGADQFDNARACAALGVAEVFFPAEATIEAIHDGITNILTNSAYTACARSVAAEIAAMPPPAHAAEALARTIGSTT